MRWAVVRSSGAVGRRFRSAVASVVQEVQEGGESADVSAARPYSEVPGPKPIPLLGNSWRFIPYVGTYRISEVDKISKSLYEQYGRIAKIEGLLGRPDLVFVFDPREIERVMRGEEEMPHRPAMPSLHHYKHVLRADFFAGDNAGLISVHGENWHRFRTRVQQPLLQPRVARKFITPIDFTATEFVQKVKGLRDENSEVPGDFLDEVHKWALESITRVVLGVRLGCLSSEHEEARQMINAVLTFFQNVGHLELRVPVWRLFNTPTLKKYIRALDVIKDTTLKNVGVAMKEWERCGEVGGDPYAWHEGDSLLRHVFTQTDDIKAASVLAVDMLLVGVDSTSVAVASTMYQLSQHQDKQETLFKELKQVLPSPDTPITNEHVDRMPYLKAVIKELMRMKPVVIGNGRMVTKDTVICGYVVPKGKQVVFPHYVVSNLEENFPQPERFLPERWLKGAGAGAGCPWSNHRAVHPFVSLPFGFGRRMCVGRRFAELEIQVLLAKMVRTFKIEYLHEPLEYSIQPMFTPDGPLNFKLTERKE
ncbi:probable cytochrome P450 49a1 [Ischnura elegans]|uniref:probable cytochrome P450 49a1 n=1 Tax=Ischnura elegans TaxID=197161 RepID=UPI001ED89040|nr:probable cytochrome P450 49a1 [Ischnura elegans]